MKNQEYTLKNCELCDLKGDDYALPRIHRGKGKKVMFVGEAPGSEEAKQHMAFVGRSGKKLDQWIEYMGIDNYYITNVVKHRPPNNRKPTELEIELCFPYLEKEAQGENNMNDDIEYVILLGRTALNLVNPETLWPFPSMPEKWIRQNKPMKFIITGMLKNTYITKNLKIGNDYDYRIFVLYHPAYVLRKHNDAEVEGYLDKIRKIISGEVSK